METLQGVLGSGGLGSKSTGSRELGAKKTREQGAKEIDLGSREQKILGIVYQTISHDS